jgi:hypothetical protein
VRRQDGNRKDTGTLALMAGQAHAIRRVGLRPGQHRPLPVVLLSPACFPPAWALPSRHLARPSRHCLRPASAGAKDPVPQGRRSRVRADRGNSGAAPIFLRFFGQQNAVYAAGCVWTSACRNRACMSPRRWASGSTCGRPGSPANVVSITSLACYFIYTLTVGGANYARRKAEIPSHRRDDFTCGVPELRSPLLTCSS